MQQGNEVCSHDNEFVQCNDLCLGLRGSDSRFMHEGSIGWFAGLMARTYMSSNLLENLRHLEMVTETRRPSPLKIMTLKIKSRVMFLRDHELLLVES